MSTVLILDDSPLIREQLRAALTELGLDLQRILLAEDLAAAHSILERIVPDLALVDLMLPDGDGAEFVREIGRRDPHAHVLVLSALPRSSPQVIQALSAGARAYLEKPVSREALRDVFEGLGIIDARNVRRIR